MEQNQLDEIKKMVKYSIFIISYLEEYLNDKIEEIIEDYELDRDNMGEDEFPHIVGYKMLKNDIVQVTINFFDECSETGIGIETIDVNLTEFINWLSKNR